MFNTSTACGQVVAQYQLVVGIVSSAIMIPAQLVATFTSMLKTIQGALLDDISSMALEMNSFLNSLNLPDLELDVDLLKDILLCPLIMAMMSDSAKQAWKEKVDSITGSVDEINEIINSEAGQNLLNGSAIGLKNKVNDFFDSSMFNKLAELEKSIEQAVWKKLDFLGLPNESIMSLLSYLYMGEQCLKDMCEAYDSVSGKFSEYCKKLKIDPVSLELNLYEDASDEIKTKMAEAKDIINGPKEKAEGLFSDYQKPKKETPFEKPWEQEDK